MDIKKVLKEHAYQNIPLWYGQAYELGCYALRGCTGDTLAMLQSVAALSALHTRATYAHVGDGVTTPMSAADQIAGICAAVFEEDIAKSSFGFLRPSVPLVMDNCGMGGDLVITANVSTIAGFIAAAAGIPMCKHGSPANADNGRHGSSDFVAMCGINPYGSRREVETTVQDHCFGYTEALDVRFKRIHMQTHKVAYLPHMNDIIGPITNPVHPSLLRRRVLGVNHLVAPTVVAGAYEILNAKGVTNMEHLIVARGRISPHSSDGVDEFSLCAGGTEVAELEDGAIRTYHLEASDFGLTPISAEAISPPPGISKGEFSTRILFGEEPGPALQMVLANASMLFKLHDMSLSLPAAYNAARDVFSSGKVADTVHMVSMAVPFRVAA